MQLPTFHWTFTCPAAKPRQYPSTKAKRNGVSSLILNYHQHEKKDENDTLTQLKYVYSDIKQKTVVHAGKLQRSASSAQPHTPMDNEYPLGCDPEMALSNVNGHGFPYKKHFQWFER